MTFQSVWWLLLLVPVAAVLFALVLRRGRGRPGRKSDVRSPGSSGPNLRIVPLTTSRSSPPNSAHGESADRLGETVDNLLGVVIKISNEDYAAHMRTGRWGQNRPSQHLEREMTETRADLLRLQLQTNDEATRNLVLLVLEAAARCVITADSKQTHERALRDLLLAADRFHQRLDPHDPAGTLARRPS